MGANLKKAGFLLAIGILVLIAFWPAFRGEFLYWDDDTNISLNPFFLTRQLSSFWLKPYYGMYIPVVYSIWGKLFLSQGPSAVAFHLLNLCTHLLNIGLVFWLFQKIFPKNQSLGFITTALFALHPLQTETVAWISGGRDLLATSFVLLAIHADNFERKPVRQWLAPLLFAGSLFCKPSYVLLPIILFCFQKDRGPFKRYLPWMLLSLAVMAVTAETQWRYEYASLGIPWWGRPFVMVDTYGFYFQKFLWPFHLSLDYGRTPQWLLSHLEEAWANLLWFAILLFLVLSRRTRKIWQGPILAFVLLLLPVSGLVDFKFQQISSVADRYMYFPLLALSWGVASQWTVFSEALSKKTNIVLGTSLVLALVLSYAVHERAGLWQTNEGFFKEMLLENPKSYAAHTNLGRMAMDRSDFTEASEHILKANELAPDVFDTIANKYILLQHQGLHDEVLRGEIRLEDENFKLAKRLEPQAYSNLLLSIAASHFAKGELTKAAERTCEALQLTPDNRVAQKNFKILEVKINERPDMAKVSCN